MTDSKEVPDVEELQELVQRGEDIKIEVLDKNRDAGLDTVDTAIMTLDDTTSDQSVEARLSAIEMAVRGLATTTDALNSLMSIVKNDIIQTVTNLDMQSQDAWKRGIWIQVLLDLLKEKNLITEPELEKTWKEVVPKVIADMQMQKDDQVTQD